MAHPPEGSLEGIDASDVPGRTLGPSESEMAQQLTVVMELRTQSLLVPRMSVSPQCHQFFQLLDGSFSFWELISASIPSDLNGVLPLFLVRGSNFFFATRSTLDDLNVDFRNMVVIVPFVPAN